MQVLALGRNPGFTLPEMTMEMDGMALWMTIFRTPNHGGFALPCLFQSFQRKSILASGLTKEFFDHSHVVRETSQATSLLVRQRMAT